MINFAETVQDERELEQLAELELVRVKRQYRIMENDRLTYAEEANNALRSQKRIIDLFESEKAELVLAIKAAKAGENAKKDHVMSETLKQLLDQRSKFMNQIKHEREQIDELKEQIVKLSKEADALKKKMRTETQKKEAQKRDERQVAILENRLEVASQRFNVLVSENVKLRSRIDDMLKERAQFNIMWDKLNSQLSTGKGVINDLIEQATIAFNQREEELNKITALKDKCQRDLKSHTSEMCELQRTMDNEMKLQEFLGVKGQHREMNDLQIKVQAEKEAKRAKLRQKIEMYNHILSLVKKFTGEVQIDKLTAQFLKQEEENFALFGYVNELNDELEGLQARVEQLRVAIDEARALNVRRGEKQAATLESIEQQLQEQTEFAETAEINLKDTNELLEKLLLGIDQLFQTLKCDNSPLMELLGDNSTVNPDNVMLYLGIIEKRIGEMLPKIHWIDRSRKEGFRLDESKKPKLRVPPLSEIAPTQPCPLCVEKEEMQNVVEGLEKPLSLPEAIDKVVARLQTDHSHLLHNVSGCHLPAARKIIQQRYQ